MGESIYITCPMCGEDGELEMASDDSQSNLEIIRYQGECPGCHCELTLSTRKEL